MQNFDENSLEAERYMTFKKNLQARAGELKDLGVDIDVIAMTEKMEREMEAGLPMLETFTKAYAEALTGNVIPQVMHQVKEGGKPQGIGVPFEKMMHSVFDYYAPESLKRENPEAGYHGGLEENEYYRKIEKAFDQEIPFIQEPKYLLNAKQNEESEERDFMTFQSVADLRNKTIDEEKREVKSEDGLMETVASLATPYMTVREQYNNLGFFGKWFSMEGWVARSVLNRARACVRSEIDVLKKNGIKVKVSASTLLHEASKEEAEVPDEKWENYLSAKADIRTKIEIPQEELDLAAEEKEKIVPEVSSVSSINDPEINEPSE